GRGGLGGDQRRPDRLRSGGAGVVLHPPRAQGARLLLVPRGRLDRVPAMVRHQNSFATPTTKICCSSQSIHPITSPRTATKMTMTVVAFFSSSQVGQVTFRTSARTSRKKSTVRPTQLPLGVASASVATYFDSLCSWCLLQRRQNFFHSTRSECLRRFFVVK